MCVCERERERERESVCGWYCVNEAWYVMKRIVGVFKKERKEGMQLVM